MLYFLDSKEWQWQISHRKNEKFELTLYAVQSRVLMRVTNSEINFLSKGHSTCGSKIPFISNLKWHACASIRDGLELATIRYMKISSFPTLKKKQFPRKLYVEIRYLSPQLHPIRPSMIGVRLYQAQFTRVLL